MFNNLKHSINHKQRQIAEIEKNVDGLFRKKFRLQYEIDVLIQNSGQYKLDEVINEHSQM